MTLNEWISSGKIWNYGMTDTEDLFSSPDDKCPCDLAHCDVGPPMPSTEMLHRIEEIHHEKRLADVWRAKEQLLHHLMSFLVKFYNIDTACITEFVNTYLNDIACITEI